MIITTCPNNSNGVSATLKNMDDISEGLTKFVPFHGWYQTFKTIMKHKPEMVIMGGSFIQEYQSLNKRLKTNGIKTGVIFCSPFGQAEINNELDHFRESFEAVQKGDLDYLFTGDFDVALSMRNNKVLWLPQTMKIPDRPRSPKDKDLCFLSSSAPNKNLINQLAGIGLSQATQVHTNTTNERLIAFADFFNIEMISKGFLPRDEYEELIATSKLGLQVSFTESFDYVVAEHFLNYTPCLVSTCMPHWAENGLFEDLMVFNPDSPLEIKEKIDAILNLDPDQYEDLQQRCRCVAEEVFTKYNSAALKILKEVLKNGND